MAYRKLTFVALLGLLAWAGLPDTSHAQRFYGGRGYGYGGRGVYVGTGYGYGGYGRGYYGPGYGGYYGPGYGYGYRPGFGAGVLVGSALSGGYYSGGNYYNSNGVVYSQPSGVATSSYQSFYPSDGSAVSTSSMSSNDCCCSAGPSYLSGTSGASLNQTQDSRGTVVVSNLPANAELYWNGSRVSTSGTVRRFGTSSLGNDGAVQKFEARWVGADGKTVSQSREIRAQANQTVNLDWANSDRTEESSAPNSPSPNQNQNPNPNQIQNQNQNQNPQNTTTSPNKGDR